MNTISRSTPVEEVDSAEQVSSNPAGAVAGGAAGAAIGAVAGIAAGPVGSLAGAVVGAVAGGLTGARALAGAGGSPTGALENNLTQSTEPTASGQRPERPEVSGDKQAEDEAERAKTALDNVQEGYEKAPPGAAGEPSWPTGGNASRGPKRPGE